MDCGTKQKVKDHQVRSHPEKGRLSFTIYCARCKRWRDVVGSEDSRYDKV